MRGLRGVIAFVVGWLSAAAVRAQTGAEQRFCQERFCEQRFYLVLYGSQSEPYRIRFTHAWATFVKTTRDANGNLLVRADTISWLPATLRIHPLALRREPGMNLNSEDTLAWARSVNSRIAVLGPYEIDREHYDRLRARRRELESGAVSYRALGGLTRKAPVSNCGQSFTRAEPVVGRRYWQPIPQPGERGVARLAARYVRAGAFVAPHVTHDWLLPILGIDAE